MVNAYFIEQIAFTILETFKNYSVPQKELINVITDYDQTDLD